MVPYTLQENPSKNDESWNFTVPPNILSARSKRGKIMGKTVSFTAQAIKMEINEFPSNRILQDDDPSMFILASFGGLRFAESTLRETADYIKRLFKNGFFLNNVQYRFYHHSNSQLRGRSCYLRQAVSDAELDDRIYKLGDFKKIMNIAKRAKRIALLFSAAEVDWDLNPACTIDIPDIKVGDEIFSDGCGLVSQRLAVFVSKKKGVKFRNKRYTPSVFQIRYLGYKGVLMLHPQLDKEKKHLVQFRQSMKKFSEGKNHTFSVVDHSKPYAFGRLNNDIIVLLSSLGITNENLLKKQTEYHQWITDASHDAMKAVDFLSCISEYNLAENVLLKGLDDPDILGKVRRFQRRELEKFRKNDRPRAPIMVHKSRLLFGVCDPFGVLQEGEVFIRILVGRRGETSAIHGDVLVVRNPCLHPGDCLKLRAVHNNRLSHLIDCIVFASVGRRAAPSMSSGGDLDGDKFFVCWDPDLVPSKVAESYDYPPNKEHISKNVTRADMANHFASYNNAGLAKVAALHGKWVRLNGAMSSECQELNALHSQSVDGASIKIPQRLLTPPDAKEPYIIDILERAASEFVENFNAQEARTGLISGGDDAEGTIRQLLRSNQNALTEYEMFQLTFKLARHHSLDLREYQNFLNHLDIGALTTPEKFAISTALELKANSDADVFLWNSLFRSDIVNEAVLYQKRLDKPYNLQRLYSSKIHGLSTFFSYLRTATQEFTRKLLILKTDDRFAIGIFMRGDIPWDDEPEVADNVVVCSFMRHSSLDLPTFRPCTKGYRLHFGDDNFQLYNNNRSDTFVFITRPAAASGAEVATSIALGKISQRVQKQIGRINRTPATAIELHVISNRDRVAHQLFDLWFEHVPTEDFIKRTAREITFYERNTLKDFDWDAFPHGSSSKDIFEPKQSVDSLRESLGAITTQQLDIIMDLAINYHADDILFESFRTLLGRLPLNRTLIVKWMEKEPQLVFVLLKVFPPDDTCKLHDNAAPLRDHVVRSIIRSANKLGIASLVALEKIAASLSHIPIREYIDLLMLTSLCVRSQDLVQEILLVMNECRKEAIAESEASAYAHKHALAVAFDRAEEAADECPCDGDGRPKRQRTAPTIVQLSFIEDNPSQVKAAVRVDLVTQVRLHSHIRLQAASKTEKEWVEAPVLDGVVILSTKGELTIDLMHTPPPEMSRMDWKMYNAGSIATSKAMMDAITRLAQEGSSCCAFQRFITNHTRVADDEEENMDQDDDDSGDDTSLNPSQIEAVRSCEASLSLIWGPPGTGKTETVVHILNRMLRGLTEETKILMTASTHNAVDNVLERFLKFNEDRKMLQDERILRVATDNSKVNKALQGYTINARVGGDMNENSRLVKEAQKRVEAAVIVFTTCAGSGLGILRKVDFDVVLIDEASQITEPCALIPLVKGCQRAVMVGDHKQLRPTVGRMGTALEYDLSMLERLYDGYKGVRQAGIRRTMLNIQYRFPKELAEFPSREFYDGGLKTGIQDSSGVLSVLKHSDFPWPTKDGLVIPTVFIPCSSEEDSGGRSKSNAGQAEVVATIVSKLTSHTKGKGKEQDDEAGSLKITVLTPYTKQAKTLRQLLPSSIHCSTVDSFQGRESDIIIFSTVRCNIEGDIGFVEDKRRLNVMWTRAKLALIIVGDHKTMTGKDECWRRAIDSCSKVILELPVTV